MYPLFKHITLTIALAVGIQQFAVAQGDYLDSNLRRYQSLKYLLVLGQDVPTFFSTALNDKNAQKKIDDYFESKNIPCVRVKESPGLPVMSIEISEPVVGGTIGHPASLCQVELKVFDNIAKTNVILWRNEDIKVVFSGSTDDLANAYYDLITSNLNRFANAWSSCHKMVAKVYNTPYTIDKSNVNWIVKYHKDMKIVFHSGTAFSDEKVEFAHDGDVEALKPGEWIEMPYKDSYDGVERMKVVNELDRRASTAAAVPNSASDKSEDTKLGDYTVYKVRNGNWMIKFHTLMSIRLQPQNKVHIIRPDYILNLNPGEYVEKQNKDHSFTLLEDLDHR